jgi:hypothetical protein
MLIMKKHLSKSYKLFVVGVAFFCSITGFVPCSALAQEDNGFSSPELNRRNPQTPEELFEVVTNPKHKFEDRDIALNRLHSLPEPEKSKYLVKILQSQDVESFSLSAAIAILRSRHEGSGLLVSQYVPQWTRYGHARMLSEVENLILSPVPGGDLTVFEIPRAILRHYVNLSPNQASAKERVKLAASGELNTDIRSDSDIIGWAGTLLGFSQNQDDVGLVRSVAHQHPESRGLWLALSRKGGITATEKPLIKPLFESEKTPPLLRLAVAIALAADDARAKNFVIEKVSDYITRYIGFTDGQFYGAMLSLILPQKPASQIPPEQKQQLSELQSQAAEILVGTRMLGQLHYFRGIEAEDLAFRALDMQSLRTKRLAGVIIATRWPERLIADLDKNKLSGDIYSSLLAWIALQRPELKHKVLEKITVEELEKWTVQMQKRGSFAVYGLEAYAFLGY